MATVSVAPAITACVSHRQQKHNCRFRRLRNYSPFSLGTSRALYMHEPCRHLMLRELASFIVPSTTAAYTFQSEPRRGRVVQNRHTYGIFIVMRPPFQPQAITRSA